LFKNQKDVAVTLKEEGQRNGQDECVKDKNKKMRYDTISLMHYPDWKEGL